MALYDCYYECCETFSIYRSYVFVTISYIFLWIGFILWAFMGSFWATVDIHGVAFTYFGLHRVCDEWDPIKTHSAYDVIGIHNDVFLGTGHVGYYTNVSAGTEDPWSQCFHTLQYVMPNDGMYLMYGLFVKTVMDTL